MNAFQEAVAQHLGMLAVSEEMERRVQEHNRRLDRAIQGLRSGAIKVVAVTALGEGVFAHFVESASGNEYCVLERQGELSCSCPDFQKRNQLCKHALAVLLLKAGDIQTSD